MKGKSAGKSKGLKSSKPTRGLKTARSGVTAKAGGKRATPAPVRRPGRPIVSDPKEDDNSKVVVRRAGENLMEAVGGREALMAVLEDSTHPKAAALAERLMDSQYASESFATSYTAVGLKAIDVLEILGDVQKARVFINALLEGDHVMRSLIRRAKDKLETHTKCKGKGYIEDKGGKREPCVDCSETGYQVKPGDHAAQQLYFELVEWKKQGGMVQIGIDARRQTQNNTNNGGVMQVVAGTLPGAAPDVLNIVKRADQVLSLPNQPALPAADQEISIDTTADEVMEAEMVPEQAGVRR